MLNQFEDMLINPLIKKLNEHGVNIDADTVKRAVSNSPQVVAQIEAALLSGTSQEKFQKIMAILTQASQSGTSTASTNTTNQTAK